MTSNAVKKLFDEMSEQKTVYIGLGSNLEQPEQQIKKAIQALNSLNEIVVLKDSGYFSSKPMGPSDQPDFINAVVELKTTLIASELLEACQLIEHQQGRVKNRRWGERTIDLDILLYADEQIETDALTIPHPGICLRDFVYLPLLKLVPDIVIHGKGRLKDMVATTEDGVADYNCQYAGDVL